MSLFLVEKLSITVVLKMATTVFEIQRANQNTTEPLQKRNGITLKLQMMKNVLCVATRIQLTVLFWMSGHVTTLLYPRSTHNIHLVSSIPNFSSF